MRVLFGNSPSSSMGGCWKYTCTHQPLRYSYSQDDVQFIEHGGLLRLAVMRTASYSNDIAACIDADIVGIIDDTIDIVIAIDDCE